MMQPPGDEESNEFLLSLLYALKRAIQFVYQVEEQEVGAELIGQGEHHRLLLWEEAEGGTGIWERLAREPHALAEVARQALALCHLTQTLETMPMSMILQSVPSPATNVSLPTQTSCTTVILTGDSSRDSSVFSLLRLPSQ